MNETRKKPRLAEHYLKIRSELQKELGGTNFMEIPRLQKVILNMGVGEAIQNSKLLDAATKDLSTIAGQKAVITKSKKSIAQYKLRKGLAIGCCVTLRKERMYEFLDRLINVAVPRIRDFRGFSPKAFDGRGNYSLGIKEQIIFPEIDYDKVDKIRSLGVTIVTSAKTDMAAKALLEKFDFPFRK